MGLGRILCVDDEETGLLVRKMMLESEGFQVSVASDGISGLELFGNSVFDVVVLDHSMPGMNGGEVARYMRDKNPAIPIILLSAYVTLPEEHVALVDAYLTKGDSTENLLAMIRKLLPGRNLEATE